MYPAQIEPAVLLSLQHTAVSLSDDWLEVVFTLTGSDPQRVGVHNGFCFLFLFLFSFPGGWGK